MHNFKIVGKTLQQVYERLPIGDYTRLLVDETGFYNPTEHEERFGYKYVQSYCPWDEHTLYIQIHTGKY